jgi:uncharacterized damage-inducible protein DinB
MNPEMVVQQLKFSNMVVKANVGEISHEESLKHPSPGGNCANWVLGHLVATRSGFLRALGGEPVWSEPESEPYRRHGPPIRNAEEAKPLAEIWKAYDLSQERLLKTVSALTPEKLAEKDPAGFAERPDQTVGSLLVLLGFHDAYHAGQTGMLRRLVGKPPADL